VSEDNVAHEIPLERLPEGFARRLEAREGPPPRPRPAATVVLLRRPPGEGAHRGLELLLLQRSRSAGFVPGAWVFPGGRVDAADGAPAIQQFLQGPQWGALASQMEGTGGAEATAYLVAAFRETFEETGLLPGLPRERWGDPEMEELQADLVRGDRSFVQVLTELKLKLDAARAAYIAHWVTPEAEPRRYDTRFFALAVESGAPLRLQESEVSRSLWISPDRALDLHQAGELPMVFPTIRTLEALRPFDTPGQLLDHFRSRCIPRLLPRLVRTASGVGIVIPDSSLHPTETP
jgi:8-oxo-dGTP pyrophosphatase MutT (NUDIX family)